MNLQDTITAANEADEAFECALRREGYKNRWHWNIHIDAGTEALRDAYRAKITADNKMHAAFERSRH